jgi:predicted esterase
MKKITLLGLLLITVFANSQSYNLTVNNGYGSGTYIEGDTVHIWSNAVFGDDVFIDWTGNGAEYLTFDNEWHTSLIVPPSTVVSNLVLNANYDQIPNTTLINSTSYLLFGENSGSTSNTLKESFYAIPPSPKGIVFLHHGTGGMGESFFSTYERFIIIKDLVFDGYAVFTLDANERTMGDQNSDGNIRWKTTNADVADTSNNIDIKNIAYLKDSVMNEFNIPTNTPCFTLGMSNGANFSDLCASALNFNASAHITANGSFNTYLRPDIAPVIWIMSENDHNISANPTIANGNFSTMNATQTAEWHVLKRSPLYDDRFVRSLNNITDAQSDSVYNRLEANGYLDTDSLLTELDVSLIPASLLDNLGLIGSQKLDIYKQLLCVNADHILHSDYNKNIIRFYNQHLNTTSIKDFQTKKNTTNIYPNPNKGIFQLQIASNYNDLQLSIYSIIGELVFSSNNQTEIDISHLINGTYFITFEIDGKIETDKIIKLD